MHWDVKWIQFMADVIWILWRIQHGIYIYVKKLVLGNVTRQWFQFKKLNIHTCICIKKHYLIDLELANNIHLNYTESFLSILTCHTDVNVSFPFQ